MLERYADARRLQAASLVAFGAAIPLAFPLGVAAAALTTLRRGPVDGAVVALLGLGFVGALFLVSGGRVVGLLPIVGAVGVAIALADLLRRGGSLSLTLQVGSLMAVIALVALMAAIGDPVTYWSSLFEQALDRMAAQGSSLTPEQREAWMAAVPFGAMTGFVVGLMTLLTWVGLFVGRSWQARLVNPGGFGEEFRSLSLGRGMAIASAAVFFGNAVIGQSWILNVSALVIQIWIVQGLAYLHWLAARRGAGRGTPMLVVSYGLLGLFWATGNPLAIIVPLGGMIGEIVDFRRRIVSRHGGGAGDDGE